MPQDPIRVAIVGTSKRSSYLYAPLLRALPREVKLVSIWGRSEASARALGEQLNLPWYTDLDRLMRETAPQIGVVSVAYAANGEVGLMAVEAGLNVLLETPIAHRLREADAIITAAARRGLKIEVAEQFHRRPLEQIKLKLIESGIFGRVYASFNDFAGHGYHGVSVMRSYIGFGVRPLQVTGSVHDYELASHWSRLAGIHGPRRETQEHALIEFEGGQTGVFHWTSVGYDSPLRWWRSSRFLAEKGMGITTGVGLDVEEHLSLLSPDGEAPLFITLERRWERVDGGALVAMVAHTGDSSLPTLTWENPFRPVPQGHGQQWHDDEIGVAGCLLSLINAVRNGGEPTYGPFQARLDQEITLAMRLSARQGGRPVPLPLDPDLPID
ncbi:MAG TPA: gfo/Idh/MocA family oxidoreductase [Anaerolinea thermolimosa]|uniref:Gfo/Idh/MocA family oxidoreductase n=2 Tax=Anaerolinea thermolimosa TaxID=229919 RepID=A0A3D1JFG8_9CHLR|nr:predicted dehydrogenase [Anaerolinea thermolimosa]HCE17194.1 gfo/Idh/MocA family oxidoreductase [Anaerolinea thermolimosa]